MTNINEQVKKLLSETKTAKAVIPQELDLVEMPLEGLAAYWLAIYKSMKGKRDKKFLLSEATHSSERFISYLLELCASNLPVEDIVRLAHVRKETLLRDLERKLVIMSIAVLGIAATENPQKVMLRFLSKFSVPPIFEKQVFELVQLVINNLSDPNFNSAKFFCVDHRLKTENLIINLIFYCMYLRRQEPETVTKILPAIRSHYFREGLTLTQDGFDLDFIKFRLKLQEQEILQETKLKSEMSIELCAAIKSGISYDDSHLIAKSYMH